MQASKPHHNETVDSPSIVVPILTGMLVTLVTVAFARLAFGLILPFMRTDLGMTYQQAGNLGTVAALGYLFLVMVAGMFASKHGGRAAVVLGLSLTTVGFILLSISSQQSMLLFSMLLLGCGTAFAYTPVISLLAGCFPGRRGAVIGMTNSGIGVGMLVASFMVPYLNETLGRSAWRWSWVVFAVSSALTLVASLAYLPRTKQVAGSSKSAPAVPMYRNSRINIVALLYGVVGTTYIAQTTFMYSFALESGMSPVIAGRMSALLGILSVFAAPTWGYISDRFGRSPTLMVAVALNAVGTLIPVVWPTTAGFTVHYIMLGCTVSGMFTSILTIAAESVEPAFAPRATSYVTLFYATGQFIGPALAGLLIEYAGGFKTAFTASTIVLVLGFFLSCRLAVVSRRHVAAAADA